FFQFLMPLIGFLGSSFAEKLVHSCGNWIAGILLIGIGIKMFFDRDNAEEMKFSLPRVTTLAIATSIDALVVGVSFRCLERTGIIPELLIIGIVTFLISAAGCLVGRWSGKLLGNRCTVMGAAVLILLGLKIIIFS
ncbi:MAG: manganese efflux pump, partial [Lentisphaeria bacterium]|nr:manganese efflux pump [Lentisphaeria bacterium]